MNNQNKKNQNSKKPVALNKVKSVSAYKMEDSSKFSAITVLPKFKNQKVVL
ncbi:MULTISPECIES: hypothetical protein [Emticicia]|uniref:hypothetical protein n=1 Tax=Emticicia TaxID=312278 RepID=UPI0020A20B0F|nr:MULTISPECIES: hypothetical protein [Emticicia]UTA66895.1 hypothetical protein MB380_14925 [Emticicia sp. 21SJ11W-3]